MQSRTLTSFSEDVKLEDMKLEEVKLEDVKETPVEALGSTGDGFVIGEIELKGFMRYLDKCTIHFPTKMVYTGAGERID